MSLDKYKQIIDIPHHEPLNHKRMNLLSRAAQFSPFAALTGYEEAIKESGRLTEKERILTQEEKDIISDKINDLLSDLIKAPPVTIIYFENDLKKDGGKYIGVTAKIKKFDEVNDLLILDNKVKIKLNSIKDIKSSLWEEE